jgi:hypothetical protein
MSKKNTKITAAPATKAEAAPAIQKAPKTILESGLTYSLVSRLLNSLSEEVRASVETGPTVSLTDGRGQAHDVHQLAIDLAANLGAKKLAEVKSAYLRPRIVIDLAAKTVVLDESRVKIPFIKTAAGAKKEAAE